MKNNIGALCACIEAPNLSQYVSMGCLLQPVVQWRRPRQTIGLGSREYVHGELGQETVSKCAFYCFTTSFPGCTLMRKFNLQLQNLGDWSPSNVWTLQLEDSTSSGHGQSVIPFGSPPKAKYVPSWF